MKHSKVIVKNALKDYPLKIIQSRFYAEEDNLLYLLRSAEDKWIMKISQLEDKSPRDFEGILNWLSLINSDHPKSLKPLKTHSGQLFTTVEDSGRIYYCTIYPWIPGRILKHNLSRPSAKKWGALMADIHNRSERTQLPHPPALRTWDKVFYWEENVLFNPENIKYFPPKRKNIYQQMIQQVSKSLNQLHSQHQPPILIHGDLHLYNVKYHKGQLYALDFDDCKWGYPIQDIAIALMYTRHQPNFCELKRAFQSGYRDLREWPEQFENQLETLFMGRLLWIANVALYSDNQEEDHEERLQRYEDEFSKYLST